MRKLCMLLFAMMTLVGCGDPILEIEENNRYHWQKYMNQKEFDSLEEGMSYLEVVEIVGGGGEAIQNNRYQWRDEILMTQAYVIEFKDDQLLSKEVVELKGHSNRK
ncbi:arginyl-tRNA synthetase [Lysinibacillus contaminans]|uniref:Arginyl-tRNA synthetase n=1 Tax=Lysinibacillus contaminans TaxID=1293441 RepID=A0ABR5JY03_9BACI|nr:arginyl-tRNA synthetase [Lysinibacillus contaminans]KOS67182.1 arginyl-tRNA synthetase [Lysinibacillus contaminans]